VGPKYLPFYTGLTVLTSPLLGNSTRRLISVRSAVHPNGPRLKTGLTGSMAFRASDFVSNVYMLAGCDLRPRRVARLKRRWAEESTQGDLQILDGHFGRQMFHRHVRSNYWSSERLKGKLSRLSGAYSRSHSSHVRKLFDPGKHCGACWNARSVRQAGISAVSGA
jgi:hypothetical protein